MNENWTKFIELFLQGELSPEDTAKLQTELDRNPEMRKSLELQKQIHEAAKRNGERQLVRNASKAFHFQKTIKNTVISAIVAVTVATIGYFAYQHFANKNAEASGSEALIGVHQELDNQAELDNLPISYFEHNGKDATFLSPKGILISIPENTFLLNGAPYNGKAVVQFQEAIDASDIVKAGLSTTSGDRLLETQGMFQLKAFTPEGQRLTINEKDGIYLQVPVDENKVGMQLFDGVKTAKGEIDWQNPKPIEKLPIQANMLDLDLFPPGYEAKLNELKWKQGKKQRDSLYLSFEEEKAKESFELRINDITVNNPAVVPEEETKNQTSEKYRTDKFFIYDFNSEGKILKNQLQSMSNGALYFDHITFTTGGFQNTPNIHFEEKGKDKYKITVGLIPNSNPIQIDIKPKTDEKVIVSKSENNDPFYVKSKSKGVEIIFADSKSIRFPDLYFTETVYLLDLSNAKTPNVEFVLAYLTETPRTISVTLTNKKSPASAVSDTTIDNYIPPSKVLAIWKKDFDNTILSTRDFEKRMKAIHGTCSEKVFNVYANQLNKALWQLDEQVVKMGYTNFQAFADERVGAVKLDNAHMNTLRQFYESNISRLKDLAKNDKNVQKALEMKWDNAVKKERTEEMNRTWKRTAQVFQDEYNLNLDNVYKQLGKSKTVGVTIYGGGTVYNIDKYVRDATIARTSATITDPDTGKTAQITYNPFEATIKDAKKYGKLFMYLMPEALTSFQRINPSNGKFEYALNNDIKYNIVFVGINDDGYFIAEQKSIIGTKNLSSEQPIDLKSVSEKEFERTLEKLSKDRQKASTKSQDMSAELNWLKFEKADYNEQKLRQKNAEFRRIIKGIVHPCGQIESENPFL